MIWQTGHLLFLQTTPRSIEPIQMYLEQENGDIGNWLRRRSCCGRANLPAVVNAVSLLNTLEISHCVFKARKGRNKSERLFPHHPLS